MEKNYPVRQGQRVALLAEGVDRNLTEYLSQELKVEVALLAEGVDRNNPDVCRHTAHVGRPPRGGRG